MGELPEQQAVLLAKLRNLEAELSRMDSSETRAAQSKLMLENSLGAAESNLEMLKRIQEQERLRLSQMGLGDVDPTDPNRGLIIELDRARASRDSLAAR